MREVSRGLLVRVSRKGAEGGVLVEERRLRGETSKGRSDGVEFDLLDLKAPVVAVDHVIGSEKAEGQALRYDSVWSVQEPLVIVTWTYPSSFTRR